ncbi:MAG: hypothetical protein GY716_20110, partial [bacterium]|nr:hypothetical protein [bacterium]
RDGDPDIVATASADNSVLWYENDGSWTGHVISSTFIGAHSAVAGDVDGDGLPEVVATEGGGSRVVAFSRGATPQDPWTTSHVTTLGTTPRQVFLSDMDLDGDLDPLVASSATNRVSWFEFEFFTYTEHVLSNSATGARTVVAADLDDDGDMDVISGSELDDTVEWFENKSIHRSTVYADRKLIRNSITEAIQYLVPGDFNGDGAVDVAGIWVHDAELHWHENPGDGSGIWNEHIVADVSGSGGGLSAGDMDGDADLDLLVSGTTGNYLWFENDGADPPAFTERVLPTMGGKSIAVDMDRDGDLDLVTRTNLHFIENQGGSPPSFSDNIVDQTATAAAVADLDGDGDLDIFIGSTTSLRWYENDGQQPVSFTGHVEITGLPFGVVRDVVATDVDDDGDVDWLVAREDTRLEWYANDGGSPPTWGPAQNVDTLPAGKMFSELEVLDLNRDGNLDVLAKHFELSALSSPVEFYAGDGAVPPSWSKSLAIDDQRISEMAPVDIDGDGDLDLFAGGNPYLGWYPNCEGQYLIASTVVAPDYFLDGATMVAFEVALTHGGDPGEPDIQWDETDLYLKRGNHTVLTPAEADTLFAEVAVYLDDGSGAFEAGSDTAVYSTTTFPLVAGALDIDFAGHPGARLSPGQTSFYFIVARAEPDASLQGIPDIRLWHRQTDRSVVTDTATGVELATGSCRDRTTQPIGLPLDSDSDGSVDPLDCAPADPDTYPGATEINDGMDNSCPGDEGFGLVDEITGGIRGEPTGFICWDPQPGATVYDIVRSTTEDFSSDCVYLGVAASCFAPPNPPTGQTYHFLVRPGAPNVGSWGLDSDGNERVPCP